MRSFPPIACLALALLVAAPLAAEEPADHADPLAGLELVQERLSRQLLEEVQRDVSRHIDRILEIRLRGVASGLPVALGRPLVPPTPGEQRTTLHCVLTGAQATECRLVASRDL